MKYTASLLFVLFNFMNISNSFAQKQKDYENVMSSFFSSYNHDNSGKLCSLFSKQSSAEGIKRSWGKVGLKSVRSETGNLVSYKFIKVDPQLTDVKNRPMALFKVVCSQPVDGKKYFAFSFSVDRMAKFTGQVLLAHRPTLTA